MGNKLAMSTPTGNTGNTTDPTPMSLPNTENIHAALTPVAIRYCDWKKSAEAGFMDNAKEYMSLFVHSSFADHKACFKAMSDKTVARFKEAKPAAAGGENRVKE